MVRTRGLSYSCAPAGATGRRITDLRMKGKPLEADKRYRVVSWAAVAQADSIGVPAWEPIQEYLGSSKTIRIESLNTPKLL
jgi:sulfur-oxidizing protein SoxB